MLNKGRSVGGATTLCHHKQNFVWENDRPVIMADKNTYRLNLDFSCYFKSDPNLVERFGSYILVRVLTFLH